MIFKALAVGPYMSNCYLLGSETTKDGIIIDPGAEAGTIIESVQQLKLDIKLIIATHGHIDHVGAVNKVKELLKAPFAMHQAETIRGGIYEKTPPIDKILNHSDIIEVGDLKFEIRHTPGHSQGGIAIVGEGIVISGDTLFQGSIGRTDFPGASYPQIMTSIFEQLLVLPDDTPVYPGHGPDTTIGMERRMNPFVKDWARKIEDQK